MKDFFKFMFASMLGFSIVLIVLFFIFAGIVASMIAFADKKAVTIEPNTVIEMKLNYEIFDRAPKDPFAFFSPSGLDMSENPGLDQIIKNVEKAKNDPNVKGIMLDLSMIPSGLATVREVRHALTDFKTSGKFILAYGEIYSQQAYYLGSVADKVYLHPQGGIEFKGFSAQLFFVKGMLEKLDVDMQVIRHGKYKSAIEIFTEEEMSAANREQMDAMLSDMWSAALGDISESRDLSMEQLNLIADNLDGLDAKKAVSAGLADGLFYKDQLDAELRSRLGLDEKVKINSVKFSKYLMAPAAVTEKVSANKIAVVYAIGSIMGGKGDDRTIGSEKMSEAIRQARQNDKVKAIVLRVNSPGGSATASEVIRREVELAVKDKPVVVSMGDVAASGGYWISASASKILADPTTITGSIGVFGLVPNMKEFFDDKLGITFDESMTNKYADFPNISRPLSDYEKLLLEKQVDQIYVDFLDLVSAGRGMSKEKVDAIGQGRVWSGADAKDLGLIDGFGGLKEAIALAAEMAGISEYNLWSLPTQKDRFQQIIDELTGEVGTSRIEKELGEYYTYYNYLKQIKEAQGIQARLPYEIRVR